MVQVSLTWSELGDEGGASVDTGWLQVGGASSAAAGETSSTGEEISSFTTTTGGSAFSSSFTGGESLN